MKRLAWRYAGCPLLCLALGLVAFWAYTAIMVAAGLVFILFAAVVGGWQARRVAIKLYADYAGAVR